MQKQIIVRIRGDGTVKFDLEGYQGVECEEEYEKFLERLKNLGVNVNEEERVKKKEYYEVEGSVVKAYITY